MKFRHLEDLSVSADFSDCRKFRYSLVIEKTGNSGTNTVCVIMQNPSVADEYIADKSVQFLEKLIFQGGYPQFEKTQKIIIVNQFAYIQTHHFEGLTEQIGPRNDEVIKDAIEASDIVLLAWGKNNSYDDRKEEIFEILKCCDKKVLLETKKHPSRGFYKDFITIVESGKPEA